ncbi:MAG TPA: hypothetical protein PLV57_19290 [Phycisphaerae bacterium]|mgnify:FL=1|nr:hypothetical protein [Phycisphaerae bacterium]
MKWLIAILTAFFHALLPWVAKQSRPTAEDGDSDTATRNKLRSKVRKHFPVVAFVLPILLITGCGVRTVYVPHGTPVRLRETIKDAKVWVKDADGQVIAGEMNLPEGWYCLPVDDEE